VARHLWGQTNINPPECDTFGDGGPDTNCNVLPTLSDPNSGAHFTATNPRLNPQFGPLTSENATGISNYNSLQVNLNRQFARNFTAQVSYTYSHCIDDGSFTSSLEEFGADQVDPYNQRYDYGNCIFDIRHNISVNGLYALPFKGNRWIEGWQLATIFGAHSGLPLDITRGAGSLDNLSGETATRANYSNAPGCHPNQILNQPIPGSPDITWFNTACYTDPADGYVGNVTRNSLPGPDSLDLDFSILKNTKIT
jgi:hypothetical protein